MDKLMYCLIVQTQQYLFPCSDGKSRNLPDLYQNIFFNVTKDLPDCCTKSPQSQDANVRSSDTYSVGVANKCPWIVYNSHTLFSGSQMTFHTEDSIHCICIGDDELKLWSFLNCRKHIPFPRVGSKKKTLFAYPLDIKNKTLRFPAALHTWYYM